MNLNVAVKSSFDSEENEMNIELSGDDMGVLIGKRGQTLDSLQYLVSLVVNRKENEYVRIKLDTENYRERRKETLEKLARNIAYKVKRSRKPMALEPMNPYERRIIHSALQNDKYVITRSDGEEPYRHVTIYLKKRDRSERGERPERKGGRRRKAWESGKTPRFDEMREDVQPDFTEDISEEIAAEAAAPVIPAETTAAPEAPAVTAPAPAAAAKPAEEEIPKWKRDSQKYKNSFNWDD